MRVIAGKAKGHKLLAPEGLDVRPTLDRVKESLFSSITPYLNNAVVLDLFSGSGALGIEALSRGAESCDFVDCSKKSLAATRNNLASTKLENQARVHFSDWKAFLKRTAHKYNIVFLDPPYSKGIEEQVMVELCPVLQENGLVVLETEKIPPEFDGFLNIRQAKYGRVFITLYKEAEKI